MDTLKENSNSKRYYLTTILETQSEKGTLLYNIQYILLHVNNNRFLQQKQSIIKYNRY